MNRGAWQATVSEAAESVMADQLRTSIHTSLAAAHVHARYHTRAVHGTHM